MSDVATRLSREVAVLAGRLGDLLAAVPADVDASANGVAFLRAVAADAIDARTLGERLARRATRDGDEPIDRLIRALDLTPHETDVVLLAGMAEEHEGFGTVFRAVHPRGEPRPTAGLAAQLFCATREERHALRETLVAGRLVRSGALRLVGEEAPLFERSLVLADTLWDALAGIDVWPSAIDAMDVRPPASGLDEWLETPAARRAVVALRSASPVTILVAAARDDDAVHRAAALARRADRAAVALRVPTDATSASLRLLSLHAAVRGRVPILHGRGDADASRVVSPIGGPLLVASDERATSYRVDGPLLVVATGRVSATARRDAWRATLPELADEASRLAARFTLEPHLLETAAHDARTSAALDDRAPDADDVAASVRARVALGLGGDVQLVHPTATWDQLVVGDDRLAQLREALDRLLHQPRVIDEWGFLRGRPGARGVRMLFAGPPGTGKTLAAEVLAREIGVDLLVVDLSRLVSKWLGETEKNLAAVFDTAERAQAVLLFDEADALFGKRTEISDAHDRYANLETAYLLARLERFEGLAILSTNLRENIDDAFTRRLEYVVEFDAPSASDRERLWRGHLPDDAPLDDAVRIEELATLYPLVGGHIRNASVAAGFLAAAAGTSITRHDLVRAVRREYEKAGRAFPGAPE